jgi:phthalate 4,5-dioxygenase reductase component
MLHERRMEEGVFAEQQGPDPATADSVRLSKRARDTPYSRGVMAENAPPEMMQLRIAEKRELATGIFGFELVAPDGCELPPFTPGAHICVRTPAGLQRKYSLCGDPAERGRYAIAVKREACGRGGSASMADQTQVGDDLWVSLPRNDFPLVRSPAGYVFIAGGIGITPIRSMVSCLKAAGARLKLYYCTRSPQHTAFLDELSQPELRSQVIIHHDGGEASKALDLWPVLERPAGRHVYCCGPRGIMEAVRNMTGHWPGSAVHFEAFTEPERRAPNDRPFRVKLARSGSVVEVPVGTTILEALRAAGHAVPSSCESGTCGTCKTGLLAGEADHRDLVLARHERGDHIMVCVSRALSEELVIDR